jgi:site-specific DNA-methyltransferase (adenine-specific)
MSKNEKICILKELEDLVENRSFVLKKSEETDDNESKHNSNVISTNDHFESLDKISSLIGNKDKQLTFDVWKHKGKKYLIDGKFDEYRYAVANKKRFDTKVHTFKSIHYARLHMAQTLLRQQNINAAQRVLIALNFEKDLKKIASKNRGRRTDLKNDSSDKFEKFHTNTAIAKLANVGEQFTIRFRKIIKDGEYYFGKLVFKDFVHSILTEETNVNAVYRKLKEKIEKEQVKNKFTATNLKAQLSKVKTKEADNKKTKVKYTNPSLDNDFHNKIVCGNNLETLKQLPSDSVNIFLGSPPYNVNKVEYDVKVPLVSHAEHMQSIADVARECYRIARRGGRFVLNIAPTYPINEKDKRTFRMIPIEHEIIKKFEEENIGWKYREIVVWNKRVNFKLSPKGNAGATDPYFIPNHEYLIIFCKETWELKPEIPNAPSDITNYEYHKWGQSVWNINSQPAYKKNHPCPFSEHLVERVLKMMSWVGDTVVDCWNGSGTTTAMAAKLGRRWFACDISKKYCLYASKRTEKAYQNFLKSHKTQDETASKAA